MRIYTAMCAFNKDLGEYMKSVEEAELSDAFWHASLVQSLDTSVSSSRYFNVFLATQVKAADQGFLSTDITVANLSAVKGDFRLPVI